MVKDISKKTDTLKTENKIIIKDVIAAYAAKCDPKKVSKIPSDKNFGASITFVLDKSNSDHVSVIKAIDNCTKEAHEYYTAIEEYCDIALPNSPFKTFKSSEVSKCSSEYYTNRMPVAGDKKITFGIMRFNDKGEITWPNKVMGENGYKKIDPVYLLENPDTGELSNTTSIPKKALTAIDVQNYAPSGAQDDDKITVPVFPFGGDLCDIEISFKVNLLPKHKKLVAKLVLHAVVIKKRGKESNFDSSQQIETYDMDLKVANAQKSLTEGRNISIVEVEVNPEQDITTDNTTDAVEDLSIQDDELAALSASMPC